jgi:Ni,Fe-hydrogenase I large subunit
MPCIGCTEPEFPFFDLAPGTVGRVEGDLDVRVDIADGVVVNAWTSAELFRGFEIILRDEDPQAGLVVTPRACGICGASHLSCAAWALDTAWQTTVPRNAIITRNLGQLAEKIGIGISGKPVETYALFGGQWPHSSYMVPGGVMCAPTP